MFGLDKLKNWSHSSINDDKKELNAYQSLNDQISLIYSKIDEYIKELGSLDERLLIDYNGNKISISLLNILKDSVLRDKKLSIEQRAYESAELNRIYIEKLIELKEKIIAMAVTQTDNAYLTYINSCIRIINALLKEYNYMIAIRRSNISFIDNSDNINAGKKIKILKDQIDIRTSEINKRLTIDSLKR